MSWRMNQAKRGWMPAALALLAACSTGVQEVGSKFVKSQVIGPAGGVLLVTANDDGAIAGTSLTVPPGALSKSVTFTVSVFSQPVANLGGTAAGPMIGFGPSLTSFTQPVTIQIPVAVPAGMSSSQVVVEATAAGEITGRVAAKGFSGGLATFQVSGTGDFQCVVPPPMDAGSASLDGGGGCSDQPPLTCPNGAWQTVCDDTGIWNCLPICNFPDFWPCQADTDCAAPNVCVNGSCQPKGGYLCPTVCTYGQDQTCNDDPLVNALWGVCSATGTCSCNTGYVIDMATGRCTPGGVCSGQLPNGCICDPTNGTISCPACSTDADCPPNQVCMNGTCSGGAPLDGGMVCQGPITIDCVVGDQPVCDPTTGTWICQSVCGAPIPSMPCPSGTTGPVCNPATGQWMCQPICEFPNTPPCTTDMDCASPNVCWNGGCQPDGGYQCPADAGLTCSAPIPSTRCPPGTTGPVCDPTTGQWVCEPICSVPAISNCQSDADCTPPNVCWNGGCQPQGGYQCPGDGGPFICQSDAECPPNEFCLNGTCSGGKPVDAGSFCNTPLPKGCICDPSTGTTACPAFDAGSSCAPGYSLCNGQCTLDTLPCAVDAGLVSDGGLCAGGPPPRGIMCSPGEDLVCDPTTGVWACGALDGGAPPSDGGVAPALCKSSTDCSSGSECVINPNTNCAPFCAPTCASNGACPVGQGCVGLPLVGSSTDGGTSVGVLVCAPAVGC